MKKFMIAALAMILLATQARADGNGIEIGVMTGDASVSSSPITSVGLTAGAGVGARFVMPIPGQTNVEFTLGLSQRKYSMSMAGIDLGGGPDSTSVSATVRYRVDANEHFRPYVGAGLHNTSFDSSSLMSGGLKMASANIAGFVAEVGARMPFESGFYIDLNARQYLGSTGDLRLETSVGNALLTRVDIKNPTAVAVSVGKTF